MKVLPLLRLLLVCSLFNLPTWAEEKSSHEPSLYVALPTFLVPVIQNRQIKAAYSISLVIELTSPQHTDTVSILKPKLVDAILVDLYGVLSIIWQPNVYIPLEDLKKRLIRIAKKTVGAAVIKNVLIQEFHSQLKT